MHLQIFRYLRAGVLKNCEIKRSCKEQVFSAGSKERNKNKQGRRKESSCLQNIAAATTNSSSQYGIDKLIIHSKKVFCQPDFSKEMSSFSYSVIHKLFRYILYHSRCLLTGTVIEVLFPEARQRRTTVKLFTAKGRLVGSTSFNKNRPCSAA